MFIGENLNDRQVAVLQAVADRSCGCRFASVDGVKKEAEQTPSRFRCLYNKYDHVPMKRLNRIIDELVTEGLVEREERNGKQYVGLTDEGKRCNRIMVDFL